MLFRLFAKESVPMNMRIRQILLPLLAALIWGVAFVAQKVNTMGAWTFNSARSVFAVLFLLPVILIRTSGNVRMLLREETPEKTRLLWRGGILCGILLTVATYLQQTGINLGTEAGKASFLTALYVVLVPIVGLFLKKRTGVLMWAAVLAAAAGSFFLSVSGDFSVRTSDVLVLGCAVFFAVHIHVIDRHSPEVDCVRMSCIQFLVCAVVSALFALAFEDVSFPAIGENLLPILYLGILSSGVAYTLQMVAQKGGNPTVVSLLLCLESVFGVLAGAVILKEHLSARELLGCGLMFFAVILSQFAAGKKDAPVEKEETKGL